MFWALSLGLARVGRWNPGLVHSFRDLLGQALGISGGNRSRKGSEERAAGSGGGSQQLSTPWPAAVKHCVWD